MRSIYIYIYDISSLRVNETAESLKDQLTAGTSCMKVCTGKCMWLMFFFNYDKLYTFLYFIFFIKAAYQKRMVSVIAVVCIPPFEKP